MTEKIIQELQAATDAILNSRSPKKLVVAGPGTGKTYLFEKLLEQTIGSAADRLVLTFVNNLKDDLEQSLGENAGVFTLHGYCQSLLHRQGGLRGGLSTEFRCLPKLASLIKKDWAWLKGTESPKFVDEMRHLNCSQDHEEFYFARGDYYDAVDFDDSVYRVYRGFFNNQNLVPSYELVLIDEFQDFNELEAGLIELLASQSAIIIAGDDDQALYSKLRGASWDFIRSYHDSGEYDVFTLPFCMRCTEVVVGAVNDILQKARAQSNLEGRIDKPYRYFEPLKGEDSRLYPKIDMVLTSVQRANSNYFGKYIEEAIQKIPEADIASAKEKGEPVALIIGSRPYLPQVERYLIEVGLIDERIDQSKSDREQALEILFEDPVSNLGWRLVLSCESTATAKKSVIAAANEGIALVETIHEDFRTAVLKEAEEMMAAHADEVVEDEVAADTIDIKLTSFEGSKGLSAQHVFLIGLHSGELPRDPHQIQDIEICRFVVGLTRSKKKCSILFTQNFAGIRKWPSTFLRWIDTERHERMTVNAAYWK